MKFKSDHHKIDLHSIDTIGGDKNLYSGCEYASWYVQYVESFVKLLSLQFYNNNQFKSSKLKIFFKTCNWHIKLNFIPFAGLIP